MPNELNRRGRERLERGLRDDDRLRIASSTTGARGHVVDFGVRAAGGLEAGLLLAEVCAGGLARVDVVPGDVDGLPCPTVTFRTDHPVEACLLSQYAGWQLSADGFFGMGSGPMRAVAAVEDLFGKLEYRENVTQVVGVVESGKLPGEEVFAYVAERCGLVAEDVTLCVAPTSSQAGTLQVVARSVETALHKLYELGFDVRRIESGYGSAPLPPVAADDLTGIGRTNDAVLYGGRVVLWVRGDDDSLAEIVSRVPSDSSEAYGRPFLEIFEEAGKDFYAIDPHLFSPAEIVLQNLETGRLHQAGRTAGDVLRRSFA